ncbi:MAG: site-specific recombinase [Acidobacteriota bacterium]|jgi:DNA invertase Pin-like site-specific DNA recombinase|nr:site-specific recombinase [Acidobacteriota bacterium]
MSLPVAGYYRVSQARDGMHAPELYEDEIARYCLFRKLGLAETFSDIDYSGYKNPDRRPALADLLARRNEFSAVIVPKLSRFGRSMRHLVELFDLFDRDGIALVFLDMNIDTSTSQGRLLRHIMAAFAEYESDVKADYARANYRHAMIQGRTWGLPPFGYRVESKRYSIVEPEADIVRRMYRRYIEGASLTRIAGELNDAGLHGRRSGMWKTKQVGRTLDSPAYAGLTSLDGEIFVAQWDPIVERATWDEVQELRLPENRGQRARKIGTGGPYLLTGVITCGLCGRNAHHHRKKNRAGKDTSAYRCMTQHHGGRCRGGGVSRARAERIVTDELVRRVRFTFGEAEFISARDAWDRASLEQKRRVLTTVVDGVVIEPKGPDDAVTAPRRLRIEWRPEFREAELVAAPLAALQPKDAGDVREGRAESHRISRNQQATARRETARRRYFEEWRAVRERLVPDLTRRS